MGIYAECNVTSPTSFYANRESAYNRLNANDLHLDAIWLMIHPMPSAGQEIMTTLDVSRAETENPRSTIATPAVTAPPYPAGATHWTVSIQEHR
jgi:hypothetical protein